RAAFFLPFAAMLLLLLGRLLLGRLLGGLFLLRHRFVLLCARSGRPHCIEATPIEEPLSTKIWPIMPNLFDGLENLNQVGGLGTMERGVPRRANRPGKRLAHCLLSPLLV